MKETITKIFFRENDLDLTHVVLENLREYQDYYGLDRIELIVDSFNREIDYYCSQNDYAYMKVISKRKMDFLIKATYLGVSRNIVVVDFSIDRCEYTRYLLGVRGITLRDIVRKGLLYLPE